MQVLRNIEVLEQLRGFTFSFPASQFSKFTLIQLPEHHLHPKSQASYDGIFFLHDVIEVLISRDNHINHALIFIVKVILTQDRETLIWPQGNVACGRLNIASQDFEEG